MSPAAPLAGPGDADGFPWGGYAYEFGTEFTENLGNQRLRTTTTTIDRRWTSTYLNPETLQTQTWSGVQQVGDPNIKNQIFNDGLFDKPLESPTSRTAMETSTVRQEANAITSYTETEVRATTTTERVRAPGLATAAKWLGTAGDLFGAGSNLVTNLADPTKRQDTARVAAEFIYDAGTGLVSGFVSGTTGTVVGAGVAAGGTIVTGGAGSPVAAYAGITAGAATAAGVDYVLGEYVIEPYKAGAVEGLTNAINYSATAITEAVTTGQQLINRTYQWSQTAWETWR